MDALQTFIASYLGDTPAALIMIILKWFPPIWVLYSFYLFQSFCFNPKSRSDAHDTLTPILDRTGLSIPARYFDVLGRTIQSLETRLTNSNLRAFMICCAISFFYSFATFVVQWVITGSGNIGRLEIIDTPAWLSPDDPRTPALRALLGAYVFLAPFIFALFLQTVAGFINRRFSSLRELQFNSVCMALIVLGALLLSASGASSLAIAHATFMAMIFVLYEIGRFFDSGLQYVGDEHDPKGRQGKYTYNWGHAALPIFLYQLIIVGIASLTYYTVGSRAANAALLVLLFFLFLPATSAILDLASWRVGLFLGGQIAKAQRIGVILVLSLSIFVASVAFFFLMANLLVIFGFFSQRVLGLELNIREYIAAAYSEPFSHGLWITMMLFSPVLPTAIHLTIALLAILGYGSNPGLVRRVQEALRSDACWRHILPAFYFSARSTVPLTVFAVVAYFLYWLFTALPIGSFTYATANFVLVWLESRY